MAACRQCNVAPPSTELAWYCTTCAADRQKRSRTAAADRKAKGQPPVVRTTPFPENLRSLAARYVAIAIEVGMLPKLDGSVPCVDCGEPADDYDHRDYAKPLEVAAVCRGCNVRRGVATGGALYAHFEAMRQDAATQSATVVQRLVSRDGLTAVAARFHTKPWRIKRWMINGAPAHLRHHFPTSNPTPQSGASDQREAA